MTEILVAKPHVIAELTAPDATRFLVTRTGRDELDAQENRAAEELAAELGFLPLALEQAGAYVQVQDTRFADYLDAYRVRQIGLLERGLPVAGEYPASVATTWDLNFARVNALAAGDILRVSAFFAPDAIPVEIVGAARPSELPGDPLALDEMLAPLTSYVEAEALYLRAVELIERSHGDRHRSLIGPWSALFEIYGELGRTEDAQKADSRRTGLLAMALRDLPDTRAAVRNIMNASARARALAARRAAST
jgi:hypothetical protein